jgi:predicted PurR-regulated permease PerM
MAYGNGSPPRPAVPGSDTDLGRPEPHDFMPEREDSSAQSADGRPQPVGTAQSGNGRAHRRLTGVVQRLRDRRAQHSEIPVQPDALALSEVRARGIGSPAEEAVPYGLRVATAYAWRLILLAIAVYLVFVVLAKLTLVAVAVFVGLLIAALLRPLVDLLAQALPRGLAVAVALLLSILTLAGVFTFVANSVGGQWTTLTTQFSNGLGDIEKSLSGAPFNLQAVDLTQLSEQARVWLTQNSSSLAGQALGGAGVAVEVLTGLVLSVFCSVFFLASGERIWNWLLTQVGGDRRLWDRAARAGWMTFAGYTRGIVIIAATNATLVGLALLILRVPLALPLALLTFFAAFIPLIGSPIALFVATLVALAARGPLVAVLVLALIVVIGQIEGHLLQPMVMSRAVNVHPLAVALTVASGTLVAGVIGAVVAVPMVAVTWTVWSTLRLQSSQIERRHPEVDEATGSGVITGSTESPDSTTIPPATPTEPG